MAFADRYSTVKHSENYKKYRPTYPKEFYDILNKTIGDKVQMEAGRFRGTAIDVGCGSGQSTRNLAPYFERVLGIDISPTQIEQAHKSNTLQNVEYKVSNFDKMLVEDNTAYLVTAAAAAHWFHPIDHFYKEADRVLKPGGVLAIICYWLPAIYKNGSPLEEFNNALVECDKDERVDRLKDYPARLAESGMRDYELPYAGWKRIDTIHTDIECSLMDVLGLLGTFSYYMKYKNEYPDTPGPLDELKTRYSKMVGPHVALEDFDITMRFSTYLLIGQKL